MDGPFKPLLLFHFQSIDCFNVLNPNRLHVLSSPTIDISVFLFDGGKWIMFPEFLKDWYNIGVRVK